MLLRTRDSLRFNSDSDCTVVTRKLPCTWYESAPFRKRLSFSLQRFSHFIIAEHCECAQRKAQKGYATNHLDYLLYFFCPWRFPPGNPWETSENTASVHSETCDGNRGYHNQSVKLPLNRGSTFVIRADWASGRGFED